MRRELCLPDHYTVNTTVNITVIEVFLVKKIYFGAEVVVNISSGNP